MSKYTVELRFVVSSNLDYLGKDDAEANWPYAYGALGLADYPIFDENHRPVLNDKIIRRYYFREIGFETAAMFAMKMRTTMHEIMPYYNQLYSSEGLVTEPLYTKNMDYAEKWSRDEVTDRTGKSVTDTDTVNSSNTRNVEQDTPMNALDTGAVEDLEYASMVMFNDNSSKGTLDSIVSSRNDYTGDFDGTREHNEKGYDSPQSAQLLDYRKTFINIDLMIVEDLSDLFMGLW